MASSDEAQWTSAIEKAAEYKTQGNEAYKAGDLNGAMRQYHCGHMETRSCLVKTQAGGMGGMGGMAGMFGAATSKGAKATPEVQAELKKLHHDLCNNIATIQMKRGKWPKVVEWTSKVLDEDKTNIKALQRRAKAYWEANQLSKAEDDVNAVLAMDAEHKPSLAIKKLIDGRNAEYKKKEANMYKAMF